jgi:DNA-binding transcriptional ArsR family regulator
VKDQRKEPTRPLAKQALSHPERFEILARIRGQGDGASATELAEGLGLARVKVEYHLLVLDKADLIERADEAEGRYVAIVGP